MTEDINHRMCDFIVLLYNKMFNDILILQFYIVHLPVVHLLAVFFYYAKTKGNSTKLENTKLAR